MRAALSCLLTLAGLPLLVAAGALAGTSRVCLTPLPEDPRPRRGWLGRLLALTAPEPLGPVAEPSLPLA